MASAEKCPVCDGSGEYRPPSPHSTIMFPEIRECHGCQGRGWVEVGPQGYTLVELDR